MGKQKHAMPPRCELWEDVVEEGKLARGSHKVSVDEKLVCPRLKKVGVIAHLPKLHHGVLESLFTDAAVMSNAFVKCLRDQSSMQVMSPLALLIVGRSKYAQF